MDGRTVGERVAVVSIRKGSMDGNDCLGYGGSSKVTIAGAPCGCWMKCKDEGGGGERLGLVSNASEEMGGRSHDMVDERRLPEVGVVVVWGACIGCGGDQVCKEQVRQ